MPTPPGGPSAPEPSAPEPATPAAPDQVPGPERPGGPPQRVVDLDARSLRALAHPVRVQLLGELRKHGPSTATRLGERLGVSSGTASYHLRQLAGAGFVAEDTARGNARERWWRSEHHLTRMKGGDLVREEPEAAMTYIEAIEAANSEQLRGAVRNYPLLPPHWQEVFGLSDRAFRLTPAEAGELRRELEEIARRYRADVPEERAGAPAEAERVVLISYLLPEPEPSEGPDPEGAGPEGPGPEGEGPEGAAHPDRRAASGEAT